MNIYIPDWLLWVGGTLLSLGALTILLYAFVFAWFIYQISTKR